MVIIHQVVVTITVVAQEATMQLAPKITKIKMEKSMLIDISIRLFLRQEPPGMR